LGNYQQPENKLTYNFLALVDFINDKKFMEWLTEYSLIDFPINDIDTVLGGKSGNPDGRIELKTSNGSIVSVYIESKTYRRLVDIDQLFRHLDRLNENDKLLVITPRLSDRKIIKEINNNKIIFKSWNEIASELKKRNESISNQFIQYGEETGEFEGLGEISTDEINEYIQTIEKYNEIKLNLDQQKEKFDHKMELIFNNLSFEYNFNEYSIFHKVEPEFHNEYGRMGVELNWSNPGKRYGQWWAISYYYDIEDHQISFENEIPEICFFFDLDGNHLHKLQKDKSFRGLLIQLGSNGFENNIDGQLTENTNRLLLYRKPISEFKYININEIKLFIEKVFDILQSCEATEHPYFKEFL
jgi:hypothetical protein